MKLRALLLTLGVLLIAVFPIMAQDSPVTISFVHIFGGENDSRGTLVQQIADEFMAANPGVTIELSSPSTDYTELFNGALLAAGQGSAPTIVQIEEGLTQLAADSGFFTPIESLASAEQIATLDDLIPTVRAYYTIDGTLNSMPWNASNPILYYNQDLFTAAGLDPAAPPATFDEILSACAAIMAAESAPAACINFPMASWFPEQWVAMQNELFANNDNGRSTRATEVNFTSDAMLNVVTWLKAMDDSGYFTYSGTPNDYNGEAIAFIGGQTAMSINTSAGLALIQQYTAAQGVTLGVAPLPAPSADATNGVTVGGASLWITGGHSDAETQAAVDFIFFLTSTENDMRWHQGSGYFPIRTSSVDQLTADGWFDENPAFAIAIHQLQESAGNVANAGGLIGPASEVRQILVEGLQSIVDSGIDPAEALAAAQTRANTVLADYNSVVGAGS